MKYLEELIFVNKKVLLAYVIEDSGVDELLSSGFTYSNTMLVGAWNA